MIKSFILDYACTAWLICNNKIMESCPENPTIATCGLEAATFLKDKVVIDPYSKPSIIARQDTMPCFEVLKVKKVDGNSLKDRVVFNCLACGKLVEVVDDCGTMSAGIAEDS